MAVEVARRVRRHAGFLAVTGLILAIGMATMFYKNPHFFADAGKALVSPQLHITTGTNGLAKVQVGNSEAPAGLGNASDAGQRVQMQLLLQSQNKN